LQTSIEKPNTCPVLGVPLAITDYASAVELTRAWAEEGDRAWAVGAAATHFVTLSKHHDEFRKALTHFDLITPDGMPLVWVMNAKGAGLSDRVYGPTLMVHALQQPGMSHYLMGGSESMLEQLQIKLRERFPGIDIAGAHSPPFGPWPADEDDRIIAKIATSGAKYIWVGLGCPKQELWIARNKAKLPPGVYFAIGAAFPFHSGMVKQAPAWMQRFGLEWVFRLVSEPRRLWKRYAVYNTLFIYHVIKDAVMGR
jgi:N-acetylglucosaminyldiphosphoundecaprenol N-acetyl-beta-D-mannosaminyltransferase